MRYGTLVDLFGLVMISITLMIWLVALRLSRIDPGYFRTRDGALHWWDLSAITQVLGMVFDRRLPDPRHGPKMRRDIYVIRGLYAFGVVGSAFFFYLFLTHPNLIFAR